jgi:iduronate 2-sulfatase
LKTTLLLLLMMTVCAAGKAVERPNILFIAIDDLRPELGCYGGPQVKTPHLDALASQGMRFDRAYCQVAVCGASRASLMTGILPTRKRFRSYLTRADKDVPHAATLPEAFKKSGYTTISNGKLFHHRDDSEAESWSEPAWRPDGGHATSFDPETTRRLSAKKKRGRIYEMPDVTDDAYPDGKIAEKTIGDLQRLKQAASTGSGQARKPFFLACGFVRPHMPFYAPKQYWDLYPRDEIEIANNRFRPKGAPKDLRGSGEFRSYHLADFEVGSDAWHRMMRHGYMASVSYVDKLVGNVLAELERLELADNTIVVIWGDHGWHLGEHDFWGKHNTMHLATRVPLIVKAPGKPGGMTQSLVETSDLFPTLCDLAGISVPETVQGKSFAELLDDPAKAFRDSVYSRYGNGDAVITKGFSYTSYNGGKAEMLYDLDRDPDENENVAGSPEYAETVSTMKLKLKQRQAQAAAAGGVTAAEAPPQKAPGYDGDVPMPTLSGVRYGDHERHILDCDVVYPGAPNVKYKTPTDYLVVTLKQGQK